MDPSTRLSALQPYCERDAASDIAAPSPFAERLAAAAERGRMLKAQGAAWAYARRMAHGDKTFEIRVSPIQSRLSAILPARQGAWLALRTPGAPGRMLERKPAAAAADVLLRAVILPIGGVLARVSALLWPVRFFSPGPGPRPSRPPRRDLATIARPPPQAEPTFMETPGIGVIAWDV